jgi:hypothetical protein
MKTLVGKALRDSKGRLGARVTVDLAESDLSAEYSFGTFGMTPMEILAKREEIIDRHAKRAARHFSFDEKVRGHKVRHGETEYTIDTCVLRERGTDVELRVIARSPTGEVIRLRKVYRSVDAVVTDDDIVAMVVDAAETAVQRQATEQEHREALVQLLGAEGDE